MSVFFFSSRRRHTRFKCDWSSDVCSSDLSDTGSIQAGQEFRIGVLYRIEPGWHIYWKYPGDAGIPTTIAWQVPKGFVVHDLQWPIPNREKELGDLEEFAYS